MRKVIMCAKVKIKNLSEIKGFENAKKCDVYSDGRIYSRNKKRFLNLPLNSKRYFYLDIRHLRCIVKCPKVHRLVMLCFSDENPKEKIHHIDGNKR